MVKNRKSLLTVCLICLVSIASCVLGYLVIKDNIVSNDYDVIESGKISSNRITPTFKNNTTLTRKNTETNKITATPSVSINPTFDLGKPETAPTPKYDYGGYPHEQDWHISSEGSEELSTEKISYGYDPETNILTLSKGGKKIRSWVVDYADRILTMGLTGTDDLLLWGHIESDEGRLTTIFLKYSDEGELLCAKKIKGMGTDRVTITQLKNGFIIEKGIGGTNYPRGGVYCDDNGDPIMQWENRDIKFIVMSDGNFIFTETESEDGYASIRKYNNQGKRLWVNKCPIEPNEMIDEIVEYERGFQIITQDSAKVISLDSNGNVVNVETKK